MKNSEQNQFNHEYNQYHSTEDNSGSAEKKNQDVDSSNTAPPPPDQKKVTKGKKEIKETTKKFTIPPIPGLPQFWWFSEDADRVDNDGRPFRKYYLIYNRLIEFLAKTGFYRLKLENNTYQFIHFEDNICMPVTCGNMKDFVFDYLKTIGEDNVLEMCRRGTKNYFSEAILSGLPFKKLKFKKDDKDHAFIFFRNLYCEIASNSITTHDYKELDGIIWESKIIDFDFKLQSVDYDFNEKGIDTNCEYAKFIYLASHNPSELIEQDLVAKKFVSLCSAIGYLLHSYKNPSLTKIVLGVDHKISDDKDEQNGGTGKSIFGKFIGYLKSSAPVKGKNFKPDNPFSLQTVNVDTQLIFFNDVRSNFDFESIFEMASDDTIIEKKGMAPIIVPFEDSPKIYINTNFTLKGDGESFKRRQFIIEFSDYFHSNYSPYDEFGHLLYYDWDNNQKNLFYNFMIQCLNYYLKNNLEEYPCSNYFTRQLLAQCPVEFLDFMDNEENIKRNERIEKEPLFLKYKEIHGKLYNYQVTPHAFTKWIKKYCKNSSLHYNPHKKGQRDKSNNTEYMTIATTDQLDIIMKRAKDRIEEEEKRIVKQKDLF